MNFFAMITPFPAIFRLATAGSEHNSMIPILQELRCTMWIIFLQAHFDSVRIAAHNLRFLFQYSS